MVRGFDAQGFQVCIHAQGDRAIEAVLDAYAATMTPEAGNQKRHRIEHAGAMYQPLAARAAALGVVVASQPGFLSSLGDGFAAAFGDRGDELYAFASWRRGGNLLGPAERLTARDALALYTTQAPFAAHRETEIGSLEPGKHADLTVLDRNPLDTDPERITGIEVLATMLGGRPVYESAAIFSG
jgi:hypothetical protein